ncbi:MAG: MBL fold metallo-hydrolase [Firmicutes bacterium]|jgi:glyoxylase-like metal-dependent hydrolase (beta-lactamase superfamily II)|nr:MBL fold metallo-hydrolase [Bacillota bacterium]
MLLRKLVLGMYMTNCYIIVCEETKKAVIIDPGSEYNRIKAELDKVNIDLQFILLTHGHGDHIGAVPQLMEEYELPVYIHEQEKKILNNSNRNLTRQIYKNGIEIEPNRLLKDGEVLSVGSMNLEIIHTPGHTPGSISVKVGNIVFTGDTLFNHSIGRTDLPGGSYDTIINSIKEKLMILPDDTTAYPGHNTPTKIGVERNGNPFL